MRGWASRQLTPEFESKSRSCVRHPRWTTRSSPRPHLTEATRTALRDAYALSMPANGNPSLQAGRFDPVQTQMMARAFESPLSDMGEQDRVIMGRYEMSEEFFEDVQEHFFLYVDDASQNQGPAELAARPCAPRRAKRRQMFRLAGRPLIDWNGPDLSESRIQQLGIPPQAAEGLGVDPQDPCPYCRRLLTTCPVLWRRRGASAHPHVPLEPERPGSAL